MSTTELIKPAEFARRIGVSRMAVSKAMQDGRLQDAIVEQDGRKWLDAEKAGREWEANRRHMQVTLADKPPSKHAQHKVATPRKRPPKPEPPAGGNDGVAQEPDDDTGAVQQPVAGGQGLPALGSAAYNQARAVREQYQARLARHDFQEKTGKVIQTERVKIANFKHGQRVREAVLLIPDRVASALAAALGAEVDTGIVYNVMQSELRNVLQELAQDGRGSS